MSRLIRICLLIKYSLLSWFILISLLHNAMRKFGTFFMGHPVCCICRLVRCSGGGIRGKIKECCPDVIISCRNRVHLSTVSNIIQQWTSDVELDSLVLHHLNCTCALWRRGSIVTILDMRKMYTQAQQNPRYAPDYPIYLKCWTFTF